MEDNQVLVIMRGDKAKLIDLVKDEGAYFFSIETDFIDLCKKLSERDDNSDVWDLINEN